MWRWIWLGLGACSAPVGTDPGVPGDSDASMPDTDAGSAAAPGCNGRPELCDRSLLGFTQIIPHNAFSNAEEFWLGPNQTYPLARQLDDGIRAFSLDTHYDAHGVASFCHGYCIAGQQDLVDGLTPFADFLQVHADEVLLFELEAYISAEHTWAALEAVGLDTEVYVHDPEAGWPTLRAMIDAGTRLVIFSSRPEGAPWQLDRNAWMQATHWARPTVASLDCHYGTGDRAFTNLAHFVEDPLPRPELAALANDPEVLGARLARCEAETGLRPQLVSLDFYELGDTLDTIAAYNGFEVP